MSVVSSTLTFIEALGRHGCVVKGLALDSRRVSPGDVFLAYPGAHSDGRAFIDDAITKGAVAVIAEKGGMGQPTTAVPCLEVTGLAHLIGHIADLVEGRPSSRLWLAGVTGTNGKTSVSQWLAQALNFLARRCAVIGTLGNGFPEALTDSPNTTPDAVTLHRELARFLAEGAAACAMEVSSIGLDQGRVNGAEFDVAIFTNLTRDHLEYHGTMEAYAAAKRRLFELPGLRGAVLNLDDDFGRQLAAQLDGKLNLIGYTLDDAPDIERHGAQRLRAEDLDMTASGVAFTVRGVRFTAPVVGRFNVANLLAVIGALLLHGESLSDCAAAIATLVAPPGRMQPLGGVDQPLLVVDYAHTPDALEKVLTCLRETATARGGKLVCVFGCGGDRDPGKRSQMGAIAERLADHVMLTSDNPRSEKPQAIIAAIAAGMRRVPVAEVDRARAIADVVSAANARDVVLIAGKGHEPYQEIAGVRTPFSDIECARLSLAAWPGQRK